jgi:hypothetical protein
MRNLYLTVVCALVCIALVTGCTKDNTPTSIIKDPGYTATICHSWHCSHSYHESLYLGTSWDTSINYPDTFLSVGYFDPITVIIGIDTLSYKSAESDSSTAVYASPIYGKGSRKSLYYYIGANTVRYEIFEHISAAGSSTEAFMSK